MSDFALRCDRCHHCLDHASEPMQLVALFHSSTMLRIPKGHIEEMRYRCRSCGYVNVFHPVDIEKPVLTHDWRGVTVKKQA